MKRTLYALGVAAFCLMWAVPAGAQVADHLKCYKAKDNIPRQTYGADLNGLAPELGCVIKVPAVMLCAQASKTNVTPLPPGGGPSGTPAGNFLCYKVKCPKGTLGPVTGTDQFGNHTVLPAAPKLVCAPFLVTGGGPTTTTSTTSTTSTTLFPPCPPTANPGDTCGSCGTGFCDLLCEGGCPGTLACMKSLATESVCTTDAQCSAGQFCVGVFGCAACGSGTFNGCTEPCP